MNDRQKEALAKDLRHTLEEYRRFHVEIHRLDVVQVMRVMQDVCITLATDTDAEIDRVERLRSEVTPVVAAPAAPPAREVAVQPTLQDVRTAVHSEHSERAQPVLDLTITPTTSSASPAMTEKQAGLIHRLWAGRGLEGDALEQECLTRFGVRWRELSMRQASALIDTLNVRPSN